jgi:D-alanyl-D-alanine carboxypeptidase/D-alanyl-D-alanine-endopeptidase (penicillin-binding protein 4)
MFAALAPVLADPSLAPPVGLMVADGRTGEVILESQSAAAYTPASTVKLLTAATALTVLGVDRQLTTTVVRPKTDTVVLVGAGDPLLTRTPDLAAGGASLLDLAGQTAQALRDDGVAEIAVAVDDTAFNGPTTAEGWEAGDVESCLVSPISSLRVFDPAAAAAECVPDPDPALTAGRIFAEQLAGFGISVTGEVTRTEAPVSDRAPELASSASRPVAALVEQMLTDSDNTSAEMLAHLAGGETGDGANFTGGAAATRSALADLGVPTTDLALFDGSGLSLLDKVAPRTAMAVLTATTSQRAPDLWPIASGLAVAGSTGTLADRFVEPDAAAGRGDVRAKTGTLTGVSALSGQVVSNDGQLLTFVMITNGTEDILASRAALDAAAAALANCGCR